MLETRKQRIASRGRFARRMGVTLLIAVGVLLVALGIGVLGYHHFAGFGWVDSLLNASMILTGMGPVGTLTTTTAKMFASAYALFSGLVFLSVFVTLLTPVIHRILHRFHVDEERDAMR
jgi:hypothetical protein